MEKSYQERFLDWIERTGNRLPDPAIHFLIALFVTWVLSALLTGVDFGVIDPRTGQGLEINNQLTGVSLADFLVRMVDTYISFPPLGVVIVMVLAVGVAEKVGLVDSALRAVLQLTPRRFLTPILSLLAILSHTFADAAMVVVVPLGGIFFYAAGRHPLAGLVVAFCSIAGGLAANLLPSGIDPLLQGFTQQAAQIIDPQKMVNPLCNWAFMSVASIIIVLVSWWITDRVVEPRLASVEVDGDRENLPAIKTLDRKETRALWATLVVTLFLILLLVVFTLPNDSVLRGSDGTVTAPDAPLMRAIVPLLFLLILLPSLVFGWIARTINGHRDVIDGMSRSMSTMGYYLVIVFFAALFTSAFTDSNLGALLALKGAAALKYFDLPAGVTITGIILLSAAVNLLVGSASAKWALLSPIFVPMLMSIGISPELTQMAYRIGDSSTNVITPLLPYFPLLVAFSTRYVKGTGIGTLISLTLPYSLSYLALLTVSLWIYWLLGLPLGIQASYTYP
jgi:aminobenzoyl-glutamate transport protein